MNGFESNRSINQSIWWCNIRIS